MKINLLAFGQAADIIGKHQFVFEDVKSLYALKAKLESSFPQLIDLNCMFSVDRKMVQGDVLLIDGAEVALMPPFSGG